MDNNKTNNQNKPVSAHPDPTTPNNANGVHDAKDKTAPVSAHPDPVVPNVENKVAHDKKENEGQSEQLGKHENFSNPKEHHGDQPKPPMPGHTPPKPEAPAKDQKNTTENGESMNGDVTYEDKVIQKIIGISLEKVDGLLTADGGFFSNVAEKLVNTDNVTAGIDTEVGKKQVAVDLKIVVEYGKDIEEIYQQIKKIIAKEVHEMTHLDVIEVNVDVVDIKTKEEYEANSETVQDKLTNAAKATGEFASEQTEKAKSAIEQQKENNQ
ncbi:Asp23/Gls24 family envelope stress response protein [Enterococcus hirae]|nr:Asp23/Gls24 family envelope stress response protein [Enterococcus hirae]